VVRLVSTSMLPEEVEIESCAGWGLEGSVAPVVRKGLMAPEEVMRTRRSRRVKEPVMGLEEVLRMVRREVQLGRWIGVLWVVRDVVFKVGLGVEELEKRFGELVIARWVVSMLKEFKITSDFRWRVTATLRYDP